MLTECGGQRQWSGGSDAPGGRGREVAVMTSRRTMQADMNWFAVLDHHAIRTPDKAITLFEGETTTYGEMAGRVRELAGGLAERGVGGGEVVALLSYNCPEFLET